MGWQYEGGGLYRHGDGRELRLIDDGVTDNAVAMQTLIDAGVPVVLEGSPYALGASVWLGEPLGGG
jgi:hypothetical protein